MAGTKKCYGPAYLTGSAADVYTPPASTIFTLIYHIRLCNTDSVPRTVTLYKGASNGSTGGTEICPTKSVPANDAVDITFPNGLKMLSTDFLSGLASSASKVTITLTVEQVVV